METAGSLEEKPWWSYLGEDVQKLILTSELIYDAVKGWGADLPGGKNKFHDYSFVIFPASKAYEGFLKKLFLDMGFINKDDYYGKHFRIGKSLNPSLPKELRRESVYDKIVHYCNGPELADKLWETWRQCRNLPFHWFPDKKNTLTLPEAADRMKMIVDAIDEAFRGCKIG